MKHLTREIIINSIRFFFIIIVVVVLLLLFTVCYYSHCYKMKSSTDELNEVSSCALVSH